MVFYDGFTINCAKNSWRVDFLPSNFDFFSCKKTLTSITTWLEIAKVGFRLFDLGFKKRMHQRLNAMFPLKKINTGLNPIPKNQMSLKE